MPYSYSHGSVDPGLNAANARVASGTTIPQISGKKSSWMDRLVSAAGKLKPPAGDKFASVSGRVGRNPSAQFNLMGGLHPSYDYSFGGLNEDALKRRRKIYGSLV